MRWKPLCEFSYKSPGEKKLKIGPYLPKLLSNIKWYTFLGDSVAYYVYIILLHKQQQIEGTVNKRTCSEVRTTQKLDGDIMLISRLLTVMRRGRPKNFDSS